MKMMKKKKYNMGGRVGRPRPLSDSEKEERRIKKLKQMQEADKGSGRAAGGMRTMNKGGKVMKYKGGGKLPMVKGPDGKMIPAYAADGKGKMNKGGAVMKYNMGGKVMDYAGMPMMAEGGMVKKKKKKVSKRKSIDGVARRGRTKGRMV